MFLALKKLLKQKKLEDITVSELAEEAGISRTTFYRNYHSLNDIIEDYLERYPFGAGSPDSYSPENFALEKRLYDSFTSLKQEQQLLDSMLNSNLHIVIYNNYAKLIKGLCKGRASDIGFRTEYEQTAFVGIYFSLCYEWIRGGMQESIKEMVDICYSIIHTFYKNDQYAIPERDNIYIPSQHDNDSDK